jgi:IS30 family transposase
LRCRPKGKYKNESLTAYIREKLALTWSPEQIWGRLPIDFPQNKYMRISHSTIYRWLHEERLSQAAALKMNLRHHGHRHGEKRGKFNGVKELRERSKLALRRKRLGDWEVDTIVSRSHRECLLSVCDRKSRYCGLVLLKRRNAPEVMRGFHFLFDSGVLPLETITSDRGTEFACYKDVEKQWEVPFYFTRPRSPWQKPSVENQNGLIRQFFPNGTNFCEISHEQVAFVMDTLNNRPRKCLDFRSPAEVLHLT